MKKNLVKNFLYQASYQILLIILPIITVPIISKALGPEGVGKYNYINSIASYFILVAGLGLSNYGVREVAIVRKDRNERSKKFWELEVFNLLFTILSFIVYFIFSFFTSDVTLYLVQGIAVLSSVFDITWFFSAIEDFKRITIRNFIVKIVTFILIVIFIKDSDDLVLYFMIQSLGILFSQMSLWLSIKKYVDWVKVSFKAVMSHLKPSLEFFIAKIAMTLYQNTTKTVLGLMTSMTVVGYYSNSLTLVVMAGSIINAMNTIMIPRMSNMYGNDEKDGMISLLEKTIHLQLFFTIAICFGIITINEKMIFWFFGAEFAPIKDVVPWLAPVVIFQSLQMAIAAQYLIPKNEMKEYNSSVVLGAVVSVAVTLLFTSFIGIYGAVAGISSGYIVICVLRVKALIKQTKFRFDLLKITKFIFCGILMYAIVSLVTRTMSSSIVTTLVQTVFGFLVYFGATIILKVNPVVDFIRRSKSE